MGLFNIAEASLDHSASRFLLNRSLPGPAIGKKEKLVICVLLSWNTLNTNSAYLITVREGRKKEEETNLNPVFAFQSSLAL